MALGSSADLDLGVGHELVGRHLEIARRRAFADASGRVVVRAVAGAEPAAVVAARVAQRLALGDAAQVRADADQDQPVLVALLGAVGVGGGRLVGQLVVARAEWSGSSATLTSFAFSISSAVRLRMNTGLPRQSTVIACPSLTGARSTSIEASAGAASGFI